MDYEDSDVLGSEVGEDVGLMDPSTRNQLDEALALIELCAQRPELKAEFGEPSDYPAVVDVLGISPKSADVTRLVADAAAVLAAYTIANGQARTAPSNAAVKKVLELILKNAEAMEAAERSNRIALDNPAGTHAYALLEEAALRVRLQESASPIRRSSFRPAGAKKTIAGAVLAPLQRGIRVRHGGEAVRRIGRYTGPRVPLKAAVIAAQRQGLSDEDARQVDQFIAQMREMLWGGGVGEFLTAAATAAIASLVANSELSGFVTPPANTVLVVGAMELLFAWRPDEPVTTGGKQSLSILVEHLGRLTTRDVEKEVLKAPRETICDVARAWGYGWGGHLFDGLDFGRNRRNALRRQAYEADF